MGNPIKKHRLDNEKRSDEPKPMIKEEKTSSAMTSGETNDVAMKNESPVNLKGIIVRTIMITSNKTGI